MTQKVRFLPIRTQLKVYMVMETTYLLFGVFPIYKSMKLVDY